MRIMRKRFVADRITPDYSVKFFENGADDSVPARLSHGYVEFGGRRYVDERTFHEAGTKFAEWKAANEEETDALKAERDEQAEIIEVATVERTRLTALVAIREKKINEDGVLLVAQAAEIEGLRKQIHRSAVPEGAVVVPKWEWELIEQAQLRLTAEVQGLKEDVEAANADVAYAEEQADVSEDVRKAVKDFVDECRALFTPWDKSPPKDKPYPPYGM